MTLPVALICASIISGPVRMGLHDDWKFCRAVASCMENDFTFDRMSAWLDGQNAPSWKPGVRHPYVSPGFDDSGWRTVRIPHDWGVEGGFSCDYGATEGCLDMTGAGWYRRRFRIDVPADGGRVHFVCDGAASFAMVWINGAFVGGWPYAYTPWRVDLTPHLVRDGENVLTVRTAQFPSANRWYGGAGLYRDCWLELLPEDHIVPGSVRIETPHVTKERAEVRVDYEMSLSGRKERSFSVDKPRLWDVDDPYLHSFELEGEVFRYGIRKVGFYADARGFQLNGRRVQIRGMCLHQDLGALGNVWNRAAWKRRLEMLKSAGVNAIRMSHYRHASGLYDLCDELGLLVLDEVFDAWERGFCENDYHRLFPVWAERDVRAWVRADRNHPCVVMWSVGNEISEQRSDFGERDMARFEAIGRRLMGWVKEEDATRPVTAANNDRDSWSAPEAQWVDVYGFNYKPAQFANYRRANPDKPMFSTETGCLIGTRGEYYWPVNTSWQVYDFRSSSYALKGICRPDEEFEAWERTPSHMGGFFWTGFDYLGGSATAPNMRRKVSSATAEGAAKQADDLARYGVIRGATHTCETGLFDTAGFPNDRFWLFQAKWRDDVRVVHVLPHWNWPDRIGKNVPVMVFSNGDEVELFVNGESQGRKRRDTGWSRFRWMDVKYAPGSLRAVAYRNGEFWGGETVETTGPVRKLLAEAVTPVIAADGSEYGFVTVKAVDAEGRVVPHSRVRTRIAVSGDGEFVAADNGDGADLSPYRYPERDVFNGFLSVIVRPKSGCAGGRITVEIRSRDVGSCTVEIGIAKKGEKTR